MKFSTEKDRVSIWTEGGSDIGMGHIIRTMNLASALEAMGVDVCFFVNNELPVLEILKKNNKTYKIAPMEDVHSLYGEDDLIIVDTKKDMPGQIEFLSRRGRTVILIDNITVASELADKTILPTPFIRKVEGALVNPNIIGGPDYLIIGNNFMDKRADSIRLKYSLPLNVLVTMGGADPNHITEKVVGAIAGIKEITIDVVLGPAAQPLPILEKIASESGARVKLHHNLKDLTAMMASAHIAFTALGITVNELAFMGVPSIVISNYFDDHDDMEMLEELGIGVPLGHHSDVEDEQIVGAVEGFISDETRWEAMRIKSAALTDGLGARRVATLIKELLEQSQ